MPLVRSKLGKNALTGQFPPVLVRMTWLRLLYSPRSKLQYDRLRPESPCCASCSIISENQFTGTIPAAISQMRALSKLYAASRRARPVRESYSLRMRTGTLPSTCSRVM